MMVMRRFSAPLVSLFAVGALSLGLVQSAAAESVKDGVELELLFAQSATSGSFDGKTLTFENVGPTVFFSDRPQRVTGHVRTAHFLKTWDEGNNSFETDPPNASVSVFGEESADNVVVVLSQPKLEGTTLSYDVKVLSGKLPEKLGEVSMVIDVRGRWAAAAGGAMVGSAVGRNRGYMEGSAASPDVVYAAAPPAPCVCN